MIDFARTEPFRAAVVVGNNALATGKTTRGELEEALQIMARWPGVRRAREVVHCLDARAANPLESLAVALWFENNLPRPELQVWMYDDQGFIGIVDGIWLDTLLAYEMDGLLKYRDFGNDVLVREKLRSERITRAGVEAPRLLWNDVWKERDETLLRVAEGNARMKTRGAPRVRLYIGDPDTPAPTPTPGGIRSPESQGLRLAYDGLTIPTRRTR